MPGGPHAKRITKALDSLSAAATPLARLDSARRAREAAEALERRSIDDARAAGLTWAEIGDVYGLTKQGAQQRFRNGG
jgi:hypothetical protein